MKLSPKKTKKALCNKQTSAVISPSQSAGCLSEFHHITATAITREQSQTSARIRSKFIRPILFLQLVVHFSLQPISARMIVADKLSGSILRRTQDGALETNLDTSGGQSSRVNNLPAATGLDDRMRPRRPNNETSSLEEFLAELPTLSVGQKHSARFDCELGRDLKSFKLVWLKLSKPDERHTDGASNATGGHQQEPQNDIKLISLNEKMISPDKRFKVRRQSALKWTLTIDNVTADDNQAYYLCQTSAPDPSRKTDRSSGSRFAGGGRLNVLMPPKIVERETSDSLVQADEFGSLVLRCKVLGEPQSQLMWKREDGKSLEGAEQRFKHEMRRDQQTNQIMSMDSSELSFASVGRNQSGAYLCIASNGVQPGVSQRVSVAVLNCRSSAALSARAEPCESTSSGSESRPPPDDGGRRTSWRTGGDGASSPNQVERQLKQHRPAPPDKRRTPMAPRIQHRLVASGGPSEEVSIKRAGSSSSSSSSSSSAYFVGQSAEAIRSSYLLFGLLVLLLTVSNWPLGLSPLVCAIPLLLRNIITETRFITGSIVILVGPKLYHIG